MIANHKYGRPALDMRPTSWEWDNTGLSKAEIDDTWADILKIPNFWAGLRMLPGVDPRLVRSLATRTELYFPTARAKGAGEHVATQSAYWIDLEFGIRYPRVIVSNEKGPLAAALKYDYFLDDRAKNCLEVKAARPECKVFLNDACHNQAFDLTEQGIPRVSGFNEFAKIVLA
jgi:hypothetical protein